MSFRITCRGSVNSFAIAYIYAIRITNVAHFIETCMLIGCLQSLAFIFTALLLTIWQGFVNDHTKFKLGLWCFVASVAASGLTAAWIGSATSYYYDLGYAATAILFSFSMLLIFESLLVKKQGLNDLKKTSESSSVPCTNRWRGRSFRICNRLGLDLSSWMQNSPTHLTKTVAKDFRLGKIQNSPEGDTACRRC